MRKIYFFVLWMGMVLPSAFGADSKPADVEAIFRSQPNGVLVMEALDPGTEYKYDPNEKDAFFSADESSMRFKRVEMTLHKRPRKDAVPADIAFVDGKGNRVEVKAVDLLRLVPKLDTTGDMQIPELLLAEYNRFGVVFRREHREFDIRLADGSREDVARRAYRLGLWNNCLEPTKWEMTLDTEDYTDFPRRKASRLNLNQDRTLSHIWFYVDKPLYFALFRMKNPELTVDPTADYETIAKQAETVVVDLDGLRKVKGPVRTRVLEIGHQSKRKITPIDKELHYKDAFGLVLNKEDFSTYDDVLAQPVRMAEFTDRGFYRVKSPKVFDYGWMRQLDQVVVEQLDVPGSDCYVQITITGRDSPYRLVMGNVDMALLDEQRLFGALFGINTYPKARRHNAPPDTIQYEPDRMPSHIKPYLLMVDNATGKWGNNHEKGIEKIFLSWESIDRDVLEIYILTYERILPVWMARVRVNDDMVNLARLRRSLYTY